MAGENGCPMSTQQKACSKKREKDEEDNRMEKKKVGARMFTPEDEIVVLHGMIEMGLTIAAKELCISLQGKLSRDFSNTQLSEKIRRLKEKFFINMEHSDSLNAHDASLFELSNNIWGLNKKEKLVDGEDSAMLEKVAYFVKKLELKVELAKLDYEQM